MTELQLYKFINDGIEYNCVNDEEIYAFIPYYEMDEFINLLGRNILERNFVTALIKDTYLCVEMICICEYFNIDSKNIFKHEWNN